MKSYDDLQRFKEKTQTNHIEFKDMSEQSLNPDNTNWAIIKQLLSDGSETVLDKSQRIDVVAPQPIDPAVLIAPTPTPASVPASTAARPSVTAVDHAAPVGGSLLDSISLSLKPIAPASPAQPAAPAPEVQPVEAVKPAVPLTKVADLRPESVNQAGSSLFEQLAQSQPTPSPAPSVAPSPQPVTPQLNALLQQPAASPSPSFAPEPPQAAPQPLYQPPPVVSQPLHQPPPFVPQPQSQPGMPPLYSSQPQPQPFAAQPLFSSQPQPFAAQPQYPSQPPSGAPLFSTHPVPQPYGQHAATSSNISYKQLFSSANGSADGTVSKDMPLQSLLEKIASCR